MKGTLKKKSVKTANWPLQISYLTVGGMDGKVPIGDALGTAQAAGFDGMEPSFGAGDLHLDVSATTCRQLAGAARGMGMPIRTVASGIHWQHQLSAPTAPARRTAVDLTRKYLEVAAALGAKTILVLPGVVAIPWDPSFEPQPYGEVWKRSTASLRKLVPYAEKLGVTIALENVWNWFLPDPVAMRMFVDQFSSPRLGVYFDAGNVLVNGRAQDWVSILGRRINAVHVKNFTRTDCGGGLHGFGEDIAKGDLDWPALLAALRAVNYRGPLTAEMIPFCRLPELRLPDVALAQHAARGLRRLLE